MSKLVGGIGEAKPADDKVHAVFEKVHQHVLEKVKESRNGQHDGQLVPVAYSTQIVAGVNFFIKVKVAEGDFIHARIYQDLQGNTTLHSITDKKTETDAIDYF